jgi:hypothetical protein
MEMPNLWNPSSGQKLGSNSSAARRERCTTNQEKTNPFGSVNIEMIIKMCEWKIAENTSLENRLNKKSRRPFISVNTLPGATTTWLYDTGAEVSVMEQREFRKIPIEKRHKKKLVTMKISSASKNALNATGIFEMPVTVMGKTVKHDIIVVQNINFNAIMGVDLIKHLGLVYYAKKKFAFETVEHQFC